jgi:DHA1 family bicyclomycin/chloramphenicol resistance-like MFS transporter
VTDAAPRRDLLLILILGALTAFAPMSTDMYLPAMPKLAIVFGTDARHVQYTLAGFFLGFALGQAIYGPLIDRFGRKGPLYGGLAIFIVASFGCAVAPSIESLAVLRFAQAIGACAGQVVSRAVVRDVFKPQEGARVFAALMMINGVGPIIAPVIGGYLLLWLNWQSIFVALGSVGTVTLIAVMLRLPETHNKDHILSLAPGRVISSYLRLAQHRSFMGYSLTGAFSLAGMFAYIAGSPFVFIDLYHLPPHYYSLLFAGNAVGLLLASYANRQLLRTIPAAALISRVVVVQAAAGLVLLAAAATGLGGIFGIIVPLFVFVSCIGLLLPNATALAMAPHGREAGSASALFGVLQFGLAAISASATGAINSGTALPMAGLVALCGLLSLGVYRVMVAGRD